MQEFHLKVTDRALNIDMFEPVMRQEREDGYGGVITYVHQDHALVAVNYSSASVGKILMCSVKLHTPRGSV